ncbi:MAG: class I SAM-dependent methyltransferase [bacterium]|nr:class I SAM-dependent methyltransferase [bacterium]
MNDFNYYAEKLSAERLRKCYDLAPPSVQRFLEVESEFVRQRIEPGRKVLELGCGYGRVVRDLHCAGPEILVGIDISGASLRMGQRYLRDLRSVELAQMDSIALAFGSQTFDLVCCIQNGISAFHVDQRGLLCEAVRVAKRGGRVLFSSYSENFWEDRLDWFRLQAEYGLIGELDEAATGDGVIVCKDGFTATTVTPHQFAALADGLGRRLAIEEVEGCSVFCEIWV